MLDSHTQEENEDRLSRLIERPSVGWQRSLKPRHFSKVNETCQWPLPSSVSSVLGHRVEASVIPALAWGLYGFSLWQVSNDHLSQKSTATVDAPLISVLLFAVLVTCCQKQSENAKQEILEINNWQVLTCAPSEQRMQSCTTLLRPTWDVHPPFVRPLHAVQASFLLTLSSSLSYWTDCPGITGPVFKSPSFYLIMARSTRVMTMAIWMGQREAVKCFP